jgi:hypothetical protein
MRANTTIPSTQVVAAGRFARQVREALARCRVGQRGRERRQRENNDSKNHSVHAVLFNDRCHPANA